jgi:hypothetical protein
MLAGGTDSMINPLGVGILAFGDDTEKRRI